MKGEDVPIKWGITDSVTSESLANSTAHPYRQCEVTVIQPGHLYRINYTTADSPENPEGEQSRS